MILVYTDDEEILPPPREREMFKVHKCKYDECGKVFYDIGSLKKHQLTHGERQVRYTINDT